MTQKQLYQNLLAELDKSLIVDAPTYAYWMANYQQLPETAVQLFYEQLVKENARIDTLVAAGIDADPELAAQIINKGKGSKKKLLKFQEAETRLEEDPEEYLKLNL